MPSSDVRSSETSAQNAKSKNFQKFVSKFSRFHISRFLFSCFGRGSRKSRKFGPRENFPLYGMPPPSSPGSSTQNMFSYGDKMKTATAKVGGIMHLKHREETCMLPGEVF